MALIHTRKCDRCHLGKTTKDTNLPEGWEILRLGGRPAAELCSECADTILDFIKPLGKKPLKKKAKGKKS